MTTIVDIAKHCNVSPMTVSRVINNSGPVKEETRNRILKAIEELNYLPNTMAKSMAGQNTRILSLIVPDIVNPFYTNVCRGVEDTARKNNYTVIICNHDDDSAKEKEYIRTLLSVKVDGFLLIPGGDFTKNHIKLISEHRKPFVMIDRKPRGYIGDYVSGDSYNGAIELVNHLVERSHRRIALINGPLRTSTARDRLAGYKRALEMNQIPFDESLVFEGTGFDEKSAEEAMKLFLALENRPTAIFASNNFVAVGVIRYLRQLNMDVPQDFALACFDKIESMDLIKPTITMAVQPAYNFGTIATQLLLERIEGAIVENQRNIVLRPEILVGESTMGITSKPAPASS